MKALANVDSLTLSIIYTIGHMIIAATAIYLLTGSSIWEAGLVALIEPTLHGVWFYVLHSLWRSMK